MRSTNSRSASAGGNRSAASTNVRSSRAAVTMVKVLYGRGGVTVAIVAPVAVDRTTALARCRGLTRLRPAATVSAT